jgi:CRISPR-associated protein Cas1
MPTLYVDTQGAWVVKRDNEVLVVKEGTTLTRVPVEKLEQLVIMGRGVQASTALLIELMERGIMTSICDERGSRIYGHIVPPAASRLAGLRSQQMIAVHTDVVALELARAMIVAKLTNQRALLATTGWAAAPTAIGQIEASLVALGTANTIDVVRGYEGAGAAAYFGAWRASLPPSWAFGGRAFYPPPDPVNALLSFGYTLALNEVRRAVELSGLDSYLGTFHVIEAGRPSLALDLLEEFRPLLVDRLVLDFAQGGQMGRESFERPAERPDAVYLTGPGRERFIERYEALLASPATLPDGKQTPWRRVITLQAQALARVFRGEQERYIGFTGGDAPRRSRPRQP